MAVAGGVESVPAFPGVSNVAGSAVSCSILARRRDAPRFVLVNRVRVDVASCGLASVLDEAGCDRSNDIYESGLWMESGNTARDASEHEGEGTESLESTRGGTLSAVGAEANVNWSEFVADRIVSWRWLGLAIALALWTWAASSSETPPIGRSVEQLFGTNDPSVLDYQRLKSIFGERETILVVYRDSELFAPSGRGLERLSQVVQRIEEVSQVEEVLSLQQIEQTLRLISPILEPGSRAGYALLDPDNELAQSLLHTFDGWTHRRENDLAVMVCLIRSPDESLTPDETKETIRQLRAIVSDLPDAHVVGEPVMVEDAIEYLQRDGLWLQYGSMILLGLVILIVLKTIKWLLVAACLVLWSNHVTTWLLATLGFRQSMISSLLGSIIAVIAVATTVHLVVGYRIQRELGLSRTQAMRRSMVSLLPPIFWACLTDAAGFAALAIAKVSAVQEFGLMMAVASLVTLAGVCLLAPGLILLGPRDFAGNLGMGQRRVESGLEAILIRVRRYPQWVCGLTVFVGFVASCGFYYARIETDFTRNFREDTPIMEGYQFAEDSFGGAGLIEIAVQTPAALDRAFLAKVNNFQEALRELPPFNARSQTPQPGIQQTTVDAPRQRPADERALAKVISVVDAIQVTQRFAAMRFVPPDAIVSMMRQVLPTFTNHWYRWDNEQRQGYLRIFARTRQRQTAEAKRELLQSIERLAQQSFGAEESTARDSTVGAVAANPPPRSKSGEPARPSNSTASGWRSGEESSESESPGSDRPAYLITGLFVLLSRIVDSLLADHVATTTVAVATIAGLLWLALRDVRLAAIGMIPNVLPIFVLLGGLGWLGIPINMGVAMIAAVSIGLSIDSSIHYLWAVQKAVKVPDIPLDPLVPSASNDYAISCEQNAVQVAQLRIGTALTYSSIALVVGFVSLTTSEFVPTVYFGGLVSAAMLGGLFGNVVLLPALLAWTKTSAGPASSEGL